MTDRSRRRHLLALSLASILAFLFYSYQRGQDSFVRINDNLDGFVPTYVALAKQPILGDLHERIDPILGGLPRNCMPSTINVGVLLYFWLDPLSALVANDFLVRILAFVGMLLLLRRHVMPEGDDFVVHAASLCYALLPFVPSHFLSVAGQPLLLHGVLNLRRGRGRWSDWAIVALFPLYSSLVYIGFFVVLLLGLVIVYDLLRTRKLDRVLLGALGLISVLYAASEYRLLHQTFLDPSYTSFRVEFDRSGGTLLAAGLNGVKTFFFSQHHAASAQFPVILLAMAAALTWEIRGLRREGPLSVSAFGALVRAKPLVPLTLVSAGLSLLMVGWHWDLMQQAIRSSGLPVLRTFNFHRIQWFHPILFGLAFAFALDTLRRIRRTGAAIAATLVGLQLVCLVVSDDALQERLETGLSYRAYYSTELFREIRDYVGRPPESYRVVSLGLNPMIALYNGFSVLDGFFNDYPLEYKHLFRRAMAAELAKDRFLAEHFDGWGAHLHLYSAELGMVIGYRKKGPYTKHHATRRVRELELETAVLRELGCRYVLSAVEVANHRALGWTFERRFQRDDSPWEVYLYSL